MPDFIGPIEVPEQAPSGTFPLTVDYPLVQQLAPTVYVHSFLSGNAKIEQRFHGGNGARRWMVQKQLRQADREALLTFWANRAGAYQPFTFNAPNEDGGGGTTAATVRFADPALSLEQASDAIASTGLVLVEHITSTSSHTVSQTLTRLPDATMQTALLAQTNTLIPLVRIRVIDSGVEDILLSDRRVTVGGNTYLPRILAWGGISQSIKGGSDIAQFTLGNADRVMTELANAVDLFKARLEFSVYHVETTTKLDLWAGTVTEYDYDEGDQFALAASDGLYALNIVYPKRKISRQCWKKYKDGVNCTAASGLSTCDKSWASCVARANTNQFGGIILHPQLVSLKDNSTGTFGLGRNSITATSIIEESGYGQVLKEIFTDTDMPVPCLLAAGRDESEYYAALGVVGEGPLGAFGSGHLLDNQPNHGTYQPRTSLGAVPSNPDLFNLDETGGTPTPYRAAGTAFIQIRRNDEKGLQLTHTSEHAMTAVVRQGRTGYVWSGPGARSTVTLTNPVWIAVNIVLRALNLENASAAVQEQYFDVASAVASASVCNLSVTPLFGAGSATQFKFQGFLGDEKPARDWLEEVLNNCVGYYTFIFGKLKIGIRLHSGSADGGAYGVGNIKMGSLQIARKSPQFNHLTAVYADKEQKFAANSVAFYDEDHIAEYQEAKSTLNLVGTSTRDQAARILSARLREELGGSTAAEWRKARAIAFQTTVLGLATEPGQVCSLSHPDMPDGTGEFRLTGWRLNPDWSIDYQGETTTDSMYEYLVGPKPGDILADPAPGEPIAMPLIGVWHPNYEVPAAGDPLFDVTQKRFTVRQSYYTQADDVTKCLLSVEGYLPVNRFVTQTRPAMADLSAIGTTGQLRSATDYYVSVAAYDAVGRMSPPALAARITTPAGANTCRLFAQMRWPSGAWVGYKTYLSDSPHRLTLHEAVAVTWGTDGPAEINWGAVTSQTSSEGIPIAGQNPRIRAKVKRIVHAGVIGTNLAAVGTGYFTLGAGIITADDEYNGRLVSVIADNDGEADLWNFTVTDTVLSTNRLTVTPDPAALGIGTNDTLIIRTKATTFSATTLGDTKWQNGQYPSGNTNDETGLLLRIISGTGAGQVRRVVSNTITVHTVDRAFDPAPDATSVWIVEEASWVHQAESSALGTDVPNALAKVPVEVSNYLQQSLLVLATLVTDNAESSELHSPWREIWIYGQDALVSGGAPTLDPVTAVVLTSPLPSGWTSNPEYWTEVWAMPWVYVGLTYTPPADPEFGGVDVWRRLSTDGNEKAIYCGAYVYGGTGNGKVEVPLERPDVDGSWLFHIASRSANVANPPDFSDSAATEPVAITGKTSLTAAITGAAITTRYYNEETGLSWGPDITFNLPATTNQTWVHCDWTVQQLTVDGAELVVAGFDRTWVNPVRKIERGWGIPSDDDVAAGKHTFRFRLYLFRTDGTRVLQTNPWGNGTSNLDVTVSRQLGSAGAENTPNVTADAPGTYPEYAAAAGQDGLALMRIRVQAAPPAAKKKLGGVEVWVAPAATIADRATWDQYGLIPANATYPYRTPYSTAPVAGSYKIILLAVDIMGRANTYQAGVTPVVDFTVTTQAAGLLLSRTKGKLTYQGTQSAFEGLEVKAQSGLFSNETVGWVGNAVESASTIDLAVTAGQITLRVASITPYIGLESRFLRILHTNGVTYERFRVTANGINQGTRQITMDYTENGSVSFQNAYPTGSAVLIDFQGGWFKNLWVGGANAQGAPFYVDVAGDLRIESKGSRHPAIRIDKNNIRTAISNQANTEAPSTDIDGIAVSPTADANNVACLSLSGTSGVRTPYLKLATAFLKSLIVRYNNTTGGEVSSTDFTTSIQDFLLTGNRNNAYGISGSPGTGLRGLLQVANIILGYKLFHGSRELVNASGDINLEYGRMRFFNSGFSAAAVKAALRDGEVATWYDGANWLVYKHSDGSGNAFKINNDGTL